jgi:hypothetical protein
MMAGCVMRRRWALRSAVGGAALLLLVAACDSADTTGDELFTFRAYAAGPVDANGGQPCATPDGGAPVSSTPLTTTSLDGYQVTLTSAAIQIGAVYLNEAYNNSQNMSCIDNGTYCGEVPGGVPMVNFGPGINLLCPNPVEFSVFGNGTADVAGTGEIWLTGGQYTCTATAADGGGAEAGTSICSPSSVTINSLTDTTPVVEIAGFACPPGVTPCSPKAKGALNFEATVTISQNNRGASTNPALPGDDPICMQRIIKEYPLNLPLFPGGSLYVRADPRGWFGQISFGANPPCPLGATPTCGAFCCGMQEIQGPIGDAPAIYQFPDDNASTIGGELFGGIVGGTLPSGASVYSFAFTQSD